MIELVTIGALLAMFGVREYTSFKEKQHLMTERSELLNRIKPETAVISNLDLPELVDNVQTDEEYWVAHEKQIKEDGTFPYGGEEEVRGR